MSNRFFFFFFFFLINILLVVRGGCSNDVTSAQYSNVKSDHGCCFTTQCYSNRQLSAANYRLFVTVTQALGRVSYRRSSWCRCHRRG